MKVNKHVLDNGLKIVHVKTNSPLVCVNVLYDVGSKHENEDRTGFAHLFEHLMFEGTTNVKDFDTKLQNAGGDNNAFTSPDITNYYENLPAINIDLALWLEADRMENLNVSQEKLDIQKGVVIEEFKQRYLNQPFGDLWLKSRPLLFERNSYKWPTIGKNIEHIEDASLDEVLEFHEKHYHPNNAILSIVGGIDFEDTVEKVERYFGHIPFKINNDYEALVELEDGEGKNLDISEGEIPYDSYYYMARFPGMKSKSHYSQMLLAEILGKQGTGLLYIDLVLDLKIASSISVAVLSGIDYNIFLINVKPNDGIETSEVKAFLMKKLKSYSLNKEDLESIKEPYKTRKVFGELSNSQIAFSIAQHELLGDAENINRELKQINSVELKDVEMELIKLTELNNINVTYIS
jgi:zinc protease